MNGKKKIKRVEFILDKGFWRKLKIAAIEQELTLAGLFRNVLGNYLEDYEREKKSVNKERKDPDLVSGHISL